VIATLIHLAAASGSVDAAGQKAGRAIDRAISHLTP